MPEREAVQHLRPRGRKDVQALYGIIGVLALIVVTAASFMFLRQQDQQRREQTWESAVADIEDVRIELASQLNSQRGSAMLYDVQILARYSVGGTKQERWVTVPQAPRQLSEAQLQAFRWKGKTCFVRWKPSAPNQVLAEVS